MISRSSSKALMLVASPLSSCRRHAYPGLASASVLIRARFMRKSSMIGSSIGARKRATFSWARYISPLYRPVTPGRWRRDEPARLSRPRLRMVEVDRRLYGAARTAHESPGPKPAIRDGGLPAGGPGPSSGVRVWLGGVGAGGESATDDLGRARSS